MQQQQLEESSEQKQEQILHLIKNYNVSRTYFTNNDTINPYINKCIDHIYIINLETNVLRRNYVIKLMEKYNINFELIVVPLLSSEEFKSINNKYINISEAGCYLSHMFCLNDAMNNNYNNIIIFEDDIVLHKNFHNLFETKINSREFDILMLGANDFHFSQLNYKFIDNDMYKPHSNSKFLLGTHAIYYSNKGVTEVFKTRLNNPTFMDNNLISLLNIFNNSFLILYPNLVVTELSTTNIDHNFWITNELKEKYYYRNCFSSEFNFNDYNFIYLKVLELCKNIDITKTYEENMLILLNLYFNNNKGIIDKIYTRLVYNFFNAKDLNFIVLAK